MYINNLGHMTKMAAMPIYGKNPSKIIFSETNRLISRKLGVRHRWLKYSNVYINHDPVMTLTKFMARSTWVACASELGKLLKCHLKEKANRKLANGQNIEDSEKRKWPKGLSAPALELNTIIFKHVYWYMQVSVYRTIGPLVLKTPAAEGSFDRPAVGWPVEVSLVCKHIVLPKCLRLFPPHAEQIRTP